MNLTHTCSFLFVCFLIPTAAHAQSNEDLRLKPQFDAQRGSLTILADGKPLLINAVARAITSAGPRTTSDAAYKRTVSAANHGSSLRCVDQKHELDIEWRTQTVVSRALTVETVCTNTSDKPIVLPAIEPIRAMTADGASCTWPGIKKVLTNGKMYYDAGRVLPFDKDAIKSWWNVCLYRGQQEPGLVVGYLENNASMGRVFIEPAVNADAFSIRLESGYEPGFTLAPGASISSDRVIFILDDDPYRALEAYAQAMAGNVKNKPPLNPPINGWCSWFSVFGDVTEQEVVRNAEFVAKHLKPYGFEYIQIDDGFYRAFGDWEGNAKFPHGMKWLAGNIRELGLKPGIWFAPYVIAEGTDIHRNHPDWLVHRPDGKLKQIGPGLVEDSEQAARANPKLYSLDLSHPQAAEWFSNLFKTAANDWGYEFFKIDFVDWSTLAADKYYEPTATRAGLYRKGAELIRQAVGPKRHVLDCGPGPVSVGLIDSMRIELDQPPVTWNQYFLQHASSGPAAAKRYYYNQRTWINDADMLVMSQLTLPQSQAAATLLALSGGPMISGDRLTDLDAPRLEILKKVLPAYAHAAKPIDMFERERPEVFALPVKKSFGEWLLLAVFNTDETRPSEKTIPLQRLGLDPKKTHIAFDFWQQRFFGELKDELRASLPPSSVLLLSIHERRNTPQVISTDRHVTQGAMDLESVEWLADSKTLRGVSLGPAGTSHYVYVHLPEEHPWQQTTPFLFHDFPGYTLKMMDSRILRVQVRFDDTGRVPWQVDLNRLFGPN